MYAARFFHLQELKGVGKSYHSSGSGLEADSSVDV